MKLVTVVIKPFKLEDVREALSSIGIQGLTVTEVKGFGRQKGHAELYRGAEYSVNFLPKVKIDIAIADDQLDEVVDVISKSAWTGKSATAKFLLLTYSASFEFALVKLAKRRCKPRFSFMRRTKQMKKLPSQNA
jgi:nitrogen regulatory protein P-II 2